MKRIFVIAAALLMMVGCKETVTEGPALAENEMTGKGAISADLLGNAVVDEYAAYYGVWEGKIGSDTAAVAIPTLIKIISIENGKVLANATIDDKKMTISGEYEVNDGTPYFKLRHGYGKRANNIFEIRHGKNDTFEGAYFAKAGSAGTVVTLMHRVFKYDPNVVLVNEYTIIDWDSSKKIKRSYIDEDGKKHTYDEEGNRSSSKPLPDLNGSVQKFTEEQLKNLRKMDLEILRNTIYARHGYAFGRSYLRNLFDRAEWYVPVSDNVEKELTALEKQNIALLTRMEKYAEDHYEYFGR